MLIKEEYTLMKADVPEVTKTMIVEDKNVGGIKLVYRVICKHHKEITISGGRVPLPWPCHISFKKRIYLRPYKDNWDSEQNRLSRNLWGKPTNPLTNIWLEIDVDYKDVSKDTISVGEMVMSHKLQKHFKDVDKEFTYIKER